MKNDDKPGATPRDPRPAGAAPSDDDNALESLGKAIAEPVKGGAEPEEPRSDGKTPMAPGG